MEPMTTQPKFICVYNVKDGVHQMFPISYILAVAPLFTQSEVIESAQPVMGHTLITMMDRQGIITDHSFEEIMLELGCNVIGARPLTVVPERRTIVVPEENIISIDKNKH